MATRERKATRSNTDSPTISNSSSRSDTASPVTVGQRITNSSSLPNSGKSKSEATTPVRNPLRSTRAGSVAKSSQGGSPPETDTTMPDVTETAEDQKGVRGRPTRQQKAAAAAAETDEKTPSAGRGIRKPAIANVHNIKRNSLPALTGRAAKMSTRRNSSGRMEAILKVCTEDDAAQLVSKPKRGRPVGNSQSTAVVTSAERRALLRKKRALSVDDVQEKDQDEKKATDEGEDDSMAVDEEQEEVAEEESTKKGERRRSIDSVASKCSEATDTQSMTSNDVKLEDQQSLKEDQDQEAVDEAEADVEKKTGRGRPVGRKRKRGAKRNSPVKRAAGDPPLLAEDSEEVKVKSEAMEDEDEEEDEEVEQEQDKPADEENAETTPKVVAVEGESISEAELSEEKQNLNIDKEDIKESAENDQVKETEKEGKELPSINGELTIKVESVDEAVSVDSGKKEKDSSPSPSLPPGESLSPVSVQQICGQPAFLENNPGIENDPEMGVQVQEKIQASQKENADEKIAGKDDGSVDEKIETTDASSEGKENQNHVNVQPEENVESETKVSEEKPTEVKANEKLPVPSAKEIKKEPESPECSTKKENHLKVLGLLTLRAADQAKNEKARRREILKAFPTPPSFNLQQLSAGGDSDGGSGGASEGNGKKSRGPGGSTNQEYTGTLKTVIKLNRKNGNGASSAKGGGGGNTSGGRQSLKMTFQKGRGKGSSGQNGATSASGSGAGKDSRQSASEGEEYYTISKEGNSIVGAAAGGATGQTGGTGEKMVASQSQEPTTGRKTNNRSSQQQINAADCGGSTHSGEDGARKEEKDLVVPEKAASFSIHPDRLCQDQCFYCGGKFGLFDTPLHIAQIKTQERQKKILDNEEKLTADSCLCDACYRHVDRRANCPSYKKRLSAPASLAQQQARQQQEDAMDVDDQNQQQQGKGEAKRIRGTGPNCSLCRAKMSKNRSFALNQNVKRLEDTIRGQGIAVQWGITPVVCKLCKFYTEHLTKEMRGDAPENNNTFADNYRRRLISFYKSEEAHRKKQRQQDQRTASSGGGQQSSSSGLEQNEASRALSRNPAISIRELFPGEDEMGLSVHLPFGQAGGLRTPEGWTRSYSLLQYDDQTKQLWEELQRPYGNQSSFIRHLVLLEKYFRNGDLVLSKNASSSAATYSESVQTRLMAFDSSVSQENRTLLQQLSNAPITITQKPKSQQPPVTITPSPATLPSPPPLVPTTSASITALVVEAGASLLKKTISSLPPDLISITPSTTVTQTTNSVATTEKAAGGSGSITAPTPSASTSSSTSSASTSAAATACPSPNKRTGSPSKARETVVVTLPDTLSPQDRKLVNGKSWRPTLMPVERIELNEDGTRTMFKTADGRLLPSRVQVMSGGKPYHISIFDYNRMCILRREKLVQKAMNGQKTEASSSANNSSASTTATSSPPSTLAASTAAGGRLSIGGGAAQTQRQTIVAPTVQIPNTVLEQNSFVPVTASGYLSMTPINGASTANGGGSVTVALNQALGGTTTRRNSRSKSAASTAGTGLSAVNLGSQITATVTSSPNNNGPAAASEKEAPKITNHNWMWNPGDLSMEQQIPFTAIAAGGMGQVMDSSASAATASLLSRIPKSLTVIPQQKLM